MIRPLRIAKALGLCAALFVAACDDGAPAGNATAAKDEFVVYAGSENKPLEPMLVEAATQAGVTLRVQYLGSIDIASSLAAGQAALPDAVWPASHTWIDIGDTSKVVRDAKSIMRSPVILGVRLSKAKELGWAGGRGVRIDDVLKAAQAKKIHYGATSATQSNSGAAFYLAALHALAGNKDEPLSAADLDNPKVQAGVKTLLGLATRSSGSSGWLGELYTSDPAAMDAMVNYEAVVWETNRKLVAGGVEPMCAVYLDDATAIADSPFAYVDKGDSHKAAVFRALQDHLLSADVQARIRAMGRRTGAIGMEGDATVLSAAECFDTQRVLSPLPMPEASVVSQALGLYQTALRKPSATVYVLDFSGSMAGARERDLKAALATLLDQEQAAKVLLQSSPEDQHAIVIFSDRILAQWVAKGNARDELSGLLANLNAMHANGGTDIYGSVARGMEMLAALGPEQLSSHFPAVILMTDGESNAGPGPDAVRQEEESLVQRGLPRIPVFSIAFGEADWKQLNALSKMTSGKTFDSKKGLIQAFREAKGYN